MTTRRARWIALLCVACLPSAALEAGETVIHSFTNASIAVNGGLVLSGSSLYGTTGAGLEGSSVNPGAIFQVNTDGSNYHVFHQFTFDGVNPTAGLTLAGSTLWGTTLQGGTFSGGANFKINLDGTGYQLFPFFNGFGPNQPSSILAMGSTRLFGATVGHNLDRDGHTTFNATYSLDLTTGATKIIAPFPTTSNLGTAITANSTNVFGTVRDANGIGSVFRTVQSFTSDDGPGLFTMHTFNNTSDGSGAASSLVTVGNLLFGTESKGGVGDNGTLFVMNTDGTNFHVLHTFNGADGSGPLGLTLAGTKIYGATSGGGATGGGTLFSIDMDGNNFQQLLNFIGGQQHGATPIGPLNVVGTTIYGVTAKGGLNNAGTIFAWQAVPEPSSFVLSGVALVGLLFFAIRRKKASDNR